MNKCKSAIKPGVIIHRQQVSVLDSRKAGYLKRRIWHSCSIIPEKRLCKPLALSPFPEAQNSVCRGTLLHLFTESVPTESVSYTFIYTCWRKQNHSPYIVLLTKTDDGEVVNKCYASDTPSSQSCTPVDCLVSVSVIARTGPQNHITLLKPTGETRDEAVHSVSK